MGPWRPPYLSKFKISKTKRCAMNVRIKSPNLAALRAAVFTLSAKNLRGGLLEPPPAGNRVNVFSVTCLGTVRR